MHAISPHRKCTQKPFNPLKQVIVLHCLDATITLPSRLVLKTQALWDILSNHLFSDWRPVRTFKNRYYAVMSFSDIKAEQVRQYFKNDKTSSFDAQATLLLLANRFGDLDKKAKYSSDLLMDLLDLPFHQAETYLSNIKNPTAYALLGDALSACLSAAQNDYEKSLDQETTRAGEHSLFFSLAALFSIYLKRAASFSGSLDAFVEIAADHLQQWNHPNLAHSLKTPQDFLLTHARHLLAFIAIRFVMEEQMDHLGEYCVIHTEKSLKLHTYFLHEINALIASCFDPHLSKYTRCLVLQITVFLLGRQLGTDPSCSKSLQTLKSRLRNQNEAHCLSLPLVRRCLQISSSFLIQNAIRSKDFKKAYQIWFWDFWKPLFEENAPPLPYFMPLHCKGMKERRRVTAEECTLWSFKLPFFKDYLILHQSSYRHYVDLLSPLLYTGTIPPKKQFKDMSQFFLMLCKSTHGLWIDDTYPEKSLYDIIAGEQVFDLAPEFLEVALSYPSKSLTKSYVSLYKIYLKHKNAVQLLVGYRGINFYVQSFELASKLVNADYSQEACRLLKDLFTCYHNLRLMTSEASVMSKEAIRTICLPLAIALSKKEHFSEAFTILELVDQERQILLASDDASSYNLAYRIQIIKKSIEFRQQERTPRFVRSLKFLFTI